MKNSFVLYTNYLDQIELLNMEQRGVLFTAIMEYVNGGDLPDQMDSITQMAFSFIKAQLDRDSDKYEETCDKRREAGRKGGLAKQANARSARNARNENLANLANLADNDNDNDIENDNVNDIDNDNESDTSMPSNHAYMDPLAVTMFSAKQGGG